MRGYLLLALVTLLPTLASADVFIRSGLVKGIYSFDSAQGADLDHVTIEGFVPADTNNTCGGQDGLVGIALRDDDKGKKHLSILLAAQMAGKSVRVRVDNTRKNAYGYCFLWLVERIE